MTELCENRSLADWLKGEGNDGGEAIAKTIARQITKALEYLHGL